MTLRPATKADIPSMLHLIAQAQTYLAAQGIDQWQDGYPDLAVLEADVAAQNSYVMAENNAVIATFMAACEDDPNYAHIEGAWRTQGVPYAVLHRIAVDPAYKGAGLAAKAVDFVSTAFLESGARSVRADTHPNNASMRRLLEKTGFVLCGNITLERGGLRVGYEKVLK